ncbi:hypothetical protein IAD21_00096 [Abditibacteriota bacterium]|nr:hypothetical protein IAD21_00096 [Abditibacteriota bacterium]
MTSPSLTQSLLSFMEWFVVGSAVGGTYYGLVYLLRRGAAGCAIVLAVLFILLLAWLLLTALSFFPGLLADPFIYIPIGVGFLICIGGAFAERAIDLVKSSFAGHVVALFCTTLLGVATSIGLMFFSSLLGGVDDTWKGGGLGVGLATTPSAIPTFIWLWRASKARPGIDRHLHSSEETNSRF